MKVPAQQSWSIVLTIVCLAMVVALRSNCSSGITRFLGAFDQKAK